MKRVLSHLLPLAALMVVFLSCGPRRQASPIAPHSKADTLIVAAMDDRDHTRLFELLDSLEKAGDISKIDACFTRGDRYLSELNFQQSEIELNKALAETPRNAYDSLYYFRSVSVMMSLYEVRQNYEGVLRIALPAVEGTEQMLNGPYRERLYQLLEELYKGIGESQLNLGLREDAEKSFERAYEHGQLWIENTTSWLSPLAFANNLGQIKLDYENLGDWENSKKWMDRQDIYLQISDANPDVPDYYRDQADAMRALSHASYASGTNQMAEAARFYEEFAATDFSKTVAFRYEAAGVLLRMRRYSDSADLYMGFDSYLEESGLEATLDNMRYWKEKFEANYKSGRTETALQTASQAFDYLGDAIVKQRMSQATELATVYETQKKDAEIAEQQLTLSRQRMAGALVALVLLTAFFIIYTINRRRAARRLADMQAAKERIESELRIAREIQMGMVPNVFPTLDNLDMFAAMTPAKEVGGDLYGYVLHGQDLYFSVGDVSGKGVPASLFMAQAVRLFRTLAAEGMKPDEIAVRMNVALAENNEQGMFVTMFIGLLHLDSGKLDFCNCGHNAPVLDGRFLKMQHVNQPLGLWEDDPFEGESVPDIRGKQLLVYTDGLNEAENSSQEQFGNTRLLGLMADSADLNSHQVIDKLKDAVEQHRAGAAPNDDLTLMCLKLS